MQIKVVFVVDTGNNGAEQITVSGAVVDNNNQQSHNATAEQFHNAIADTKLLKQDSADTPPSHKSKVDMQPYPNSRTEGHSHWRDSVTTDDKRKSASSIEIQNINQGLDLRTFEEDIDMIEKQQTLESDFKLSPNSSDNSYTQATHDFNEDVESERYSAFRPIDDSEQTMNSLQRLERMNSLNRGDTYKENEKTDLDWMDITPLNKTHSKNEADKPDSIDSVVNLKNVMEAISRPFSDASSQESDSRERNSPGLSRMAKLADSVLLYVCYENFI